MDMDVSQDLEDIEERNRHVQDMSGTFPTKCNIIFDLVGLVHYLLISLKNEPNPEGLV
jgi:hypothetical protein